ncbi:hypothetical protein RN001_013136 [Aquatica leii]|uniref:Cytochrome P450 n=1 Tax=Aquatica leii TaxID=1421715 RepID=A0AAN7P1X5_9COLE|nr:hypothetical protein RN001_013136 [Aquatica leii]
MKLSVFYLVFLLHLINAYYVDVREVTFSLSGRSSEPCKTNDAFCAPKCTAIARCINGAPRPIFTCPSGQYCNDDNGPPVCGERMGFKCFGKGPDIKFKCAGLGFFPDVSKCNKFHFCYKTDMGGGNGGTTTSTTPGPGLYDPSTDFSGFEFTCDANTIYSPATATCEPNTRPCTTLPVRLLITVAFYIFLVKPLYHWKEKKITYVSGVPIFGNMWPVILGKAATVDVIHKMYLTYPDKRYIGIYNFATPTLLVRDPDLLKKIMVKDFDVFRDHRSFISSDVDPIWSKNLFAMPGDERWHEMRSTLSPAFTSSKMRVMFSLMKESAQEYTDYYFNQKDMVVDDFKDSFTKFANDVIANTAFGVKCNSLKDPTNEFYMTGKSFTFKGFRGLIMMTIVFMPTISKVLRLPLFSKKSVRFFQSIIKENIKARQEKNIIRPDMLHLLTEARKGRLTNENESLIPEAGFAVVEESEIVRNSKKRKIDITDEDITSQALLFFFGGYETMSTMFAYIAYELAINPEVQTKLQKEVDDVYKELNGDLTYEALTGMKYLDCVVSETLRKWPPFIGTNRKCTRDYTIKAEDSNETTLYMKKGSPCFIPIYSIQRDPKYYPNPDKFDPERFNETNRKSIHPFTYIPFGGGPRSCIANRFALIEGKVLIAELVRKLEFVPVEKTQIPIKFSTTNFIPIPDEGIWLGIRRRKI